MNPSSRKNPLDGAKFREQYLSNLRLQASNDQKNQNANMVFKQTGQTPSRPPDMRTTTEKASDIEALKVDLRSKLSQITDGVIASQIIGELNPDQIRFAINNWGTILPDMKKMFASGVPTSAFIAYLNRLIEKFQLTDGVETGLQQRSGNAILMSNTQLLYGLPQLQILKVLKGVLDTARRQFGLEIEPALFAIRQNEFVLPDLNQSQVLNSLPAETKAEIMAIANDMYNNVASNKEVADLIAELNIGLANRDKRYTEKAVEDAVELMTLDDSVLIQKEQIRMLVNNALRGRAQIETPVVEGGSDEFPRIEELEELPELSWEEIIPIVRSEPEYGSAKAPVDKSTWNPLISNEAKALIPRNYTREEWEKLGTKNRDKKAQFIRLRLEKNPDMVLHSLNGKEYGLDAHATIKGAVSGKGQKTRRLPFGDIANADLDNMYDEYMLVSNDGIEGEGLKVMKGGRMRGCGLSVPAKEKVVKPYRQSIAHLIDKPVEKVKPYTQFGRYFINKYRLEGEGIVAFRQPSGNTIGTLPTEKVSKPLAKVIRTLVGKGIPSYEDISELSKEDKVKLHHICKTCKVNSPAVPKMKGEGEAEEDRFNILRGEIIAGNDSPKIAKEFKVMLLKFVNEGRIPRRQANEILQELLVLGH